MSETPATYDCGAGCTCDAVTDLASERTELLDEMAAALEGLLKWYPTLLECSDGEGLLFMFEDAQARARMHEARAVLAKFRGREEGRG